MAIQQVTRSLLLLFSLLKVCNSHFGGLHYVPSTGNIAIGRPVSASSTCGSSGPAQFCTTAQNDDGVAMVSQCGICDSDTIHGADGMVDYQGKETWWQSENNVENVTVEIDFQKLFFFTYVIVSFRHVRPAVMLLEKSIDGGNSYQPLLYYADDCSVLAADLPGNGDVPCTSVYTQPTPGNVIYLATSDFPQPDLTNSSHLDRFTISNLRITMFRLFPVPGNDPATSTGASVHRYYAIDHIEVHGWCYCNGHEEECLPTDTERENSGMVPSQCKCSNGTSGTQCQECGPRNGNGPWNTGFNPSNTTCQECQCNNHTDSCHYNDTLGYGICEGCGHNTAGDSCSTCIDGYYRNSMVPVTDTDTCIECQCNPAGVISDGPLCVPEDIPGQPVTLAGTCMCKANVTGTLCDQCEHGFMTFNQELEDPCQVCSCPDCDPHTGRCPCITTDTQCCPFDQYLNVTCMSCDCDPIGSVGSCDLNGVCVCKPGVGGARCNECLHGYYNMTIYGCEPCGCHMGGSVNQSCDQSTGECYCRDKVGGVKCDTCPDGYLGPLPEGSAKACIECFCNGYSSQCGSETGWYWTEAEDRFEGMHSAGGWSSTGEIEYNRQDKLITVSISSMNTNRLVVELPSKYNGDKRTSYGMNTDMIMAIPHTDGNTAYMEIMGDSLRPARKLRSVMELKNEFEISKVAMVEDGFTILRYSHDMKAANQKEVREVLAAIKKIRLVITFDESVIPDNKYINITYTKLPYAVKDSTHFITPHPNPLTPAPVGEDCTCPVSRTGSVCDHCSTHHTTDPSYGNEFDSCVKCVCFGSSDTCDPVTGDCTNCTEGTTGTYCELCADGYYRDPVSYQCLPCDCPGGPESSNQFSSSCVSDLMGGHVCRCPPGFTGRHCESCDVGFVGDPSLHNGTCKRCSCTRNSEGGTNTCDHVTGDCVCDTGYIGEQCDICDLGYYGNALAHNCTDCDCYSSGTVPGSFCDLGTGMCLCHENVTGRDCSQCIPGHWNLHSRMGCQECDCSVLGSVHNNCLQYYGICQCKVGYFGNKCDLCDYGYWRLDNGTCTACDCHLPTSVSNSCNMSTGVCTCREGATGDKCDQCVSMTTTGLLPQCELCDECSTHWHAPINELTLAVTEAVEMGRRVNITSVTHTEIEAGRRLVRPLYDLLEEIKELIRRSMLASLRNTVTKLNLFLVGNVDIARNLLDRINVVLSKLNYTRSIIDAQLTRLGVAEIEINRLRSIVANLTSDIGLIEVMEFRSLVTVIEEALMRSNESFNIVNTSVTPAVSRTIDNLNLFADKRAAFLLLSEEVSTIITHINQRLQVYKKLFIEGNQLLCGSHDRSGGCGLCGGVTCDECGGWDGCEGIYTQLTRASNISTAAEEEATIVRELLLIELRKLSEANATAYEAAVTHQRLSVAVEMARTNINNLLNNLLDLSDVVNSLISRQLPDLDRIGLLQNTTLGLGISHTPEQVHTLLVSINDTIDAFPLLTNVNNTELRKRADRALEISQQANDTLSDVLKLVSMVTDQLQYLRDEGTRANKETERLREQRKEIEVNIDKAKSSLDATNSSIISAMFRIKSLNNTLQSVKESFDINREQLLKVMNTANTVEGQTVQLQQNTSRTAVTVDRVNDTVREKLSSAQETLFNVTTLKEQLVTLRNISHSQMLRARGLLNTNECIMTRQAVIRDDIHRVAVELERVHNEIETNIARNTVCLRRKQTSKKK